MRISSIQEWSLLCIVYFEEKKIYTCSTDASIESPSAREFVRVDDTQLKESSFTRSS